MSFVGDNTLSCSYACLEGTGPYVPVFSTTLSSHGDICRHPSYCILCQPLRDIRNPVLIDGFKDGMVGAGPFTVRHPVT